MASLLVPPASCRGILPPAPPRQPAQRARTLIARAARSCYRFRTDDDGVVDVAVAGKDGEGYTVAVEVPPLPDARGQWCEGGLVVRAADSGAAVPLACSPTDGVSRAPFNLSFLLTDGEGVEVRTHRRTAFLVPIGCI